jgi:hypothetical protein
MAASMHDKDIGLVNTREMFKKARGGGYAVPATIFIIMPDSPTRGTNI